MWFHNLHLSPLQRRLQFLHQLSHLTRTPVLMLPATRIPTLATPHSPQHLLQIPHPYCLQPLRQPQSCQPRLHQPSQRSLHFSFTMFAPTHKQGFVSSHFYHELKPRLMIIPGVTLFIFLTFIVRVILSPTLSMVFVCVTYSLIWLPQIIRSARRGRSSGLRKEYVIGTTVCRLYLALCEGSFFRDNQRVLTVLTDFLACPKNVLDVEPRCSHFLPLEMLSPS